MTKTSVAIWRERFFKGIEGIVFVLVLTLLALITLQVFTRYVLQVSLPWTEEVARMVLIWTVMLGATIAMERGEHYTIVLIYSHLRGVTKRIVLITTNIIGIIFLIGLAVFATQYSFSSMRTVYVATDLPRGWINIAVPVGAVIMATSLAMHSIHALLHRDVETPPSDKNLPIG